MRRLLTGMVLAGTVLGACTPAAQPSPSTGAGAQPTASSPGRAENQKFNWGQPGIWSSLDPTAINIGRAYDIYETLTTADPTGKNVEPLLAASWTSVDPTTWEFKLRPNSKWHDGQPVTATDVKWSFDHYTDPALKAPIATRIQLFQEARVVDPQTVRIVTKQPDPLLLRAMFDVPILPGAYYDKIGKDEFRIKPIGSGPFKLKQYIPEDRVVLEPFADHPAKKAIFTEVTIRSLPEPSARIAGLRTGELDMITDVAPDQAETLKNEKFEIVSTVTGNVFGFWTDSVIENSPTKDKRVRLALNYAIDKDAIIKTIFRGFQSPVKGQPVSEAAFGSNPNLKAYPYDPAMAKRLLAEAGYPNGFKTTVSGRFTNTAYTSLIQFVQQNLKDVGIEVEIINIPPGAGVLDRFVGTVPREPMFFIEIATRPALDAQFALTWFQSTNPGSNGSGTKHYSNPEYDRVFQASTTEMDVKKREALLQQALQILYDDPPYLALYDNNLVTANKTDIKGIVYRVTDIPQLHTGYRAK